MISIQFFGMQLRITIAFLSGYRVGTSEVGGDDFPTLLSPLNCCLFFFFFNIYLFIWLRPVLVAALRIFVEARRLF